MDYGEAFMVWFTCLAIITLIVFVIMFPIPGLIVIGFLVLMFVPPLFFKIF